MKPAKSKSSLRRSLVIPGAAIMLVLSLGFVSNGRLENGIQVIWHRAGPGGLPQPHGGQRRTDWGGKRGWQGTDVYAATPHNATLESAMGAANRLTIAHDVIPANITAL